MYVDGQTLNRFGFKIFGHYLVTYTMPNSLTLSDGKENTFYVVHLKETYDARF